MPSLPNRPGAPERKNPDCAVLSAYAGLMARNAPVSAAREDWQEAAFASVAGLLKKKNSVSRLARMWFTLFRCHCCADNLAVSLPNLHAEIPTLPTTTPNSVGKEPPLHRRLLVPRPSSPRAFFTRNLQGSFFGNHISCLLVSRGSPRRRCRLQQRRPPATVRLE